MSPPPITLKGGHFTLTVVHLHHTDPQVIQHALQHKVAQAPAFLSQAPIVINIAKLTAQADWKKIAQAIRAVGLHLIGIAGCCNNEQRQLIQAAGLPLLCEGKGAALQEHTPPTLNINTAKPKCRVIEHPVRSGQQIYASEGDLIVMSAVSAGAEVIAEGHLHLYGVMRGRAIAGAGGDATRRIFCTHLQAELVSIAGQYWLSDQIPRQFWQSAVTISRQNEQLIIKALS